MLAWSRLQQFLSLRKLSWAEVVMFLVQLVVALLLDHPQAVGGGQDVDDEQNGEAHNE